MESWNGKTYSVKAYFDLPEYGKLGRTWYDDSKERT